jgi:HK97 family phage portal protein
MGLLRDAVKAVIQLGGTGAGWSVPTAHDVIYSSPWDEVRSTTGRTVTDSDAMSYAPFFAGVRLISTTVGRLPLVLYRKTSEDERERASGRLLYTLLHAEPNPAMSALVFKETLQGHILLRGNAIAEMRTDDLGRVAELWPLPPHRTQVLWDTDREEKFYRVRIESLGDVVDLPARRVFHIPGYGFDGRVGYSLVSLFRNTLSLGLSAEEFAARFYKSGARPAGILTHPKGWSKTTRDEFAATFRAGYAGLSNAQRVAIIEDGISWQDVGMNLDDAQFLETRAFQRGEAATILGVPPHLIGDVEKTTSWGTGVEEQTLAWIVFGLGDHTSRWEAESNRQLARPAYGDTHYYEFVIEALLKGRAEDRMRVWRQLFDMGVVNADYIAKRENIPVPEDGSGKVHWIPANYQRVSESPDEADAGPDGLPIPRILPPPQLTAGDRAAIASIPSAAAIAEEVVRLTARKGAGSGQP